MGQKIVIKTKDKKSFEEIIARLVRLEENQFNMNDVTQQKLDKLGSDIQAFKQASTDRDSAKDKLIAELQAQLASETALDATDKQTLNNLQAANVQAEQELQTKIDALDASLNDAGVPVSPAPALTPTPAATPVDITTPLTSPTATP